MTPPDPLVRATGLPSRATSAIACLPAARIAAGYSHRLAVEADGSVWAWGFNYDGELGNGGITASQAPQQVPGLTGISSVAAGGYHSLALTANGNVWAWGFNQDGELGTGAASSTPVTSPVQVPSLSSVVALSGGRFHSLALKSDGTVWSWGLNSDGQLGNGSTSTAPTAVPIQVAGLSGVVAISAGAFHSLALKSDGTVWAWGDNLSGQLGDGSQTSRSSPVLTMSGVTAIAAGGFHSLALASGALFAWGNDYYGQLGDGSGYASVRPLQVQTAAPLDAVTAGENHSLAITTDGQVLVWGYNEPPTPTAVPGINAAIAVATGTHQLLALDSAGQLWEWGLEITPTPVEITGFPRIIPVPEVGAGGFHSSATIGDGTVYTWGYDADGQLGDGSLVGREQPAVLADSSFGGRFNSGRLIGGPYFSMLRGVGEVWAFGDNRYGQFGDSTTRSSSVPVLTAFYTDFRMAAGGDHTLAVDINQFFWASGRNDYGQLGDGTTNSSANPVRVAGMPAATASWDVSAGRLHSLAQFDRTVRAWGYNGDGELGNGTTVDSHTPVQVTSLANLKFQFVAAQAFGSMASVSTSYGDGSVYAWGYNGDGELGNGTTTNSLTPVHVSGLASVTQIQVGDFHAIALKQDGTVWTWGANDYGQLGTGNTTPSSVPVQLASLTNVANVAAGGDHTLAVTNDGKVWEWGARYRTTPSQVAGLTNLGAPAVSGIGPTSGAPAGGTGVTISGRGFTGAAAVMFGQAAAASFTVVSPNQINAVTPVGQPGTVDVSVRAPSCTTLSGPPSRFTYGTLYDTSSTNQYSMKNSDGTSWRDIDNRTLQLVIVPPADSTALINANADLWTANAGYNQDIAIRINGVVAGWKESGGYAGTFSPNAAFVQTVFPMTAGTRYVVSLAWKTNRPASGATIFAGAGPINGRYSPTRLVAQLISSQPTVSSMRSVQQYHLTGNNGTDWRDIDPSLQIAVTPSASGQLLVSGNADLWTADPGFNQDFAINVNGQVAGWKESGGFAGTFSPNAAMVQTVVPVTGGTPYAIKLQWKTNRADSGTIYAGAGPINAAYSPTALTVVFLPTGGGLSTAISERQYSLANSGGQTWVNIDTQTLNLPVAVGSTCLAVLSGNADLWTATAGYNQDLGLAVNGQTVAWKESGGFAGTFSPNAAFVQGVYLFTSGSPYTVSLQWKANKPASGASIYAGAGPIGTKFSPTLLTIQLVSCS